MIKCFKLFGFILSVVLLKSCASIAPPNGGDADKDKPKVVKTIPKSGMLNFKGKTVKYHFSEWIQEDKLKQQIIITPEVDDFEIKIVKNILTLTFSDTAFKPNTTYNINLRDGIKDLNEGIKSDSNRIVFSTGPYIDSITLAGKSFFGADNKNSRDIVVALYPVTDTFKIEKQVPIYSTKTDTSSRFIIDNIKPGNYFLYSFKDENNNGKYDKNKEAIAYLSENLNLTSSLSIDYLKLYREDFEKPKVTYKENKKKGVTKVEFNKELSDVSIKSLNSNKKIIPLLKNKTVILFTDQPSQDSVKLVLNSTDLFNNTGADTLGFVFNFIDTSASKVSSIPTSGSEIEPTDSIEIFLSKPFTSFNPILKIRNGRNIAEGSLLKEQYQINTHFLKSSVSIIPKAGWQDTVNILVYPTSFTLLSGYIKDTLKIKYAKKDLEKYGSIGGEVITNQDNILLQLLSGDRIVKQVAYKKNFLFEYLADGDYRIRVVVDSNRNKKWDQGNYMTRLKPESIFHYPDPVKLKSNWEILDLKISF